MIRIEAVSEFDCLHVGVFCLNAVSFDRSWHPFQVLLVKGEAFIMNLCTYVCVFIFLFGKCFDWGFIIYACSSWICFNEPFCSAVV